MSYIKLFEEYFESLNEGQIAIYGPGNPYTPIKDVIVDGVNYGSNGLQWKKFYDPAQIWLDQGFAISVVVSDFIPNSDELGYNKKTTNPKYRSEINGTWGDKSLPLFMDEHPGYDESEFDLVKIDKKLMERDGVYIQDKKGNEFCIHASRILDVQLGSSIKDDIHAGATYLIDKMKGRISNYQNGKITVSFKTISPKSSEPSNEPGSTKEYTLEEWRAKNYMPLDENEHIK